MSKKVRIPESSNMHIFLKIKKEYNYAQFMEFCKSLYGEGYNDGQEEMSGIDLTEVLSIISSVKGIGPKLLKDIEVALCERLDDSESNKDKE